MVTLIDFVVALFTSALELVVTFVFEVLLGVDPLTAVLVLLGSAFVALPSVAFGYLALGGIVNSFTGIGSSAPDAPPQRRA